MSGAETINPYNLPNDGKLYFLNSTSIKVKDIVEQYEHGR